MKKKILFALLLATLPGCGAWSAAAGVAYDPNGGTIQRMVIDQGAEEPTPTPEHTFN